MIYPIGIQDFEKLRQGNYLYIDKTTLIYKLASGSGYYFLSRPRRFGKSLLISTMEAYFLGKKELFKGLAMEKLEQNWKQYLRKHGSRFDRDEFDYEVKFHTDLQDDRMEKGNVKLSWLLKQQKLLVVVDESHNLRNDKSSRYQMLLNDILAQAATDKVRDVKVLLLSATPINNGLLDIRNQFKLIAQGNNEAFNTDDFQIANLEQLFLTANKRFNEWCQIEGRTIKDFIDTLPPNFFNLTDKLIVARTRNMIEKTLGEDLGFPKKLKPVNEYVGLVSIGSYETIADVYEAMLKANLTAYQPTQYMQAKAKTDKDWQDNTFREKFLVKMMAVLFMKRLESCWYSCLTTIDKVLRVHDAVRNWHTRFEGNLREGTRRRLVDERRMGRGTLNDRAQRHDGILFLGFRKRFRNNRQLIGARNAHEREILLVPAMTDERIDRALDELFHQEGIEPAGDQRNLQTLRFKISVNFFHSISPQKTGVIITQTAHCCQKTTNAQSVMGK